MIVLEIITAAEVISLFFIVAGLIMITIATKRFMGNPHLGAILYEFGYGSISIGVMAALFFGTVYVLLV